MMPAKTPRVAVNRLIGALRDHDLQGAVELYEGDAMLAVYPGMVGQGTASIRTFFEGIFRLNTEIRYEVKNIIEVGDLALFTAKWTIIGSLSADLPKTSHQATVMRKQPDGNWLIAVDNPWGAAAPAN